MSSKPAIYLTATAVLIALVGGSSSSAFAAVCKTTGKTIVPVQRLGSVSAPRVARIVRPRPVAARSVQSQPVAVVASTPQPQSTGGFEPTSSSAPRAGALSNVFRDLAGGGGDGGGGGGGGGSGM